MLHSSTAAQQCHPHPQALLPLSSNNLSTVPNQAYCSGYNVIKNKKIEAGNINCKHQSSIRALLIHSKHRGIIRHHQSCSAAASASGSAISASAAAEVPAGQSSQEKINDVQIPVNKKAEEASRSSLAAAAAAAARQHEAGLWSRSSGLTSLTAVVTVRRKRRPSPPELLLDRIDAVADSSGQKIWLQLVSAEIDDRTGCGRRSSKAALLDWSLKAGIAADKIQYVAHFTLDVGFGLPAAIAIENHHQNELFIETIALTAGAAAATTAHSGPILYFPCYSWVQPKYKTTRGSERVFFNNHASLPSQTPAGLRELREQDKAARRGNGKGVRKPWDNIYDYDVYNDVGNPDKHIGLARTVLGGTTQHPYPRRCRTGRQSTKTFTNMEKPLDMGTNYYVPRDESFHEVKQESFITNSLKGVVRQSMPLVTNSLKAECENFECFHAIDRLYQEGVKLRDFQNVENEILKRLPMSQAMKTIEESTNTVTNMLQYSEPTILSRDRFAWMRDDEFGRQTLAGANPVQIRRLTEFPPKSALDPEVYGPSTSAITEEHIVGRLEGLTVEEAMENGKLFILDYHDAYMPFVNKVNALEGRKMYATRTILFQSKAGNLVPLAIELSLPPTSRGEANGRQRVFTPGQDSASHWKWQLAKAHVSSNDAGFHQLVNHWLRSHASVEPYVIASHRQLSRMHPVFKLLEPHFRYTLEINASARQLLINADGVIENCFTPGPFSLDISSAAYASTWRFDHEGLPADLLNRGMARRDDSEASGVKLVLEDYPYAADGLVIWEVIRAWVDEYVSLYYDDERGDAVKGDAEIQAWWDEIRSRGHADKKDEAWWPSLDTADDLKGVLTTMIWVVSGFHAAINFGQYAYGGYVPNRPCMTRRLVPEDGTPEHAQLMADPEAFFLSTIPSQVQATTVMAVVDSLSSHSPDEEYLGQRPAAWTADPRAHDAFARFSAAVQAAERTIAARNADPTLKARNGAGVMPYDLLLPTSGPGKTGRGIPNSISI